jgi:hypothetical protein
MWKVDEIRDWVTAFYPVMILTYAAHCEHVDDNGSKPGLRL